MALKLAIAIAIAVSPPSAPPSSSPSTFWRRPISRFPLPRPFPSGKPRPRHLHTSLRISRAQTLPPSPCAPGKPSAAEESKTLVDVCNEGVLCTASPPDGWPFGSSVRFAYEAEHGSPVLSLHPSHPHSQHLQSDCRCSLHIQMELRGHRKTQCTFKGRVSRVEDTVVNEKLKGVWEKRFGEEPKVGDCFHLMKVESVIHSSDIGEPIVVVSTSEYECASADPLRGCAAKIVEDMNRNHWEDIRRFCNVYGHLNLSVEEARLTWVDRLGFDMSVLTRSQELIEVRIPFSREVVDERDARSSLTMMAQRAWEHERGYTPPPRDIQMTIKS